MELWQVVGFIVDYGIRIIAIGWVPEGRKPSSSNAWLLCILVIPVIGLPLFLLMGSNFLSLRRYRLQKQASEAVNILTENIPDVPTTAHLDSTVESLCSLNRTLTNIPALWGTSCGLYSDYTESINRMTEVIDLAQSFVHVEIYIVAWDNTTDRFFRALERAAARGVKVRLLYDHVGSWKYPGYTQLGRRLNAIGVEWYRMLPILPWKLRFRRPDLRNHRKIVIVDGVAAFMGSQNLIDPTYLVAKNRRIGRQWHDVMVEMRGPIVQSLLTVFATDWYFETNERLIFTSFESAARAAELAPNPHHININVFQTITSGPAVRTTPNLRLFTSIVHHAQKRLIICSPYFIPDESLLDAITTAAYRGVEVDLLVNERSDSLVVYHAQNSYYRALLEAGVRIYQYPAPAVLHTKFLLADPEELQCFSERYTDAHMHTAPSEPTAADRALGIVGSSNMDMRSFDLNYEVCLMTMRGPLMDDLTTLAAAYIARSHELTLDQWKKRSRMQRYWDNAFKLMSGLV